MATPGQMVGVVGATGAGSPLSSEINSRLFDPQEGLSRLVARIFEETSARRTLRKTVSIVLRVLSLVGPLQIIFIKGKVMPACQKWNACSTDCQTSGYRTHGERNKFESQVEERGANFLVDKNGCPLPVGFVGVPVSDFRRFDFGLGC